MTELCKKALRWNSRSIFKRKVNKKTSTNINIYTIFLLIRYIFKIISHFT